MQGCVMVPETLFDAALWFTSDCDLVIFRRSDGNIGGLIRNWPLNHRLKSHYEVVNDNIPRSRCIMTRTPAKDSNNDNVFQRILDSWSTGTHAIHSWFDCLFLKFHFYIDPIHMFRLERPIFYLGLLLTTFFFHHLAGQCLVFVHSIWTTTILAKHYRNVIQSRRRLDHRRTGSHWRWWRGLSLISVAEAIYFLTW